MSIRTKVARAATGAFVGIAIGIGAYTFIYAKGASYLTNDSASCANCHVMQGVYDSWTRSSHHAVAGCNDCHTPPGLVARYASKARDGFLDSVAFTSGRFPDSIRMSARSVRITERACRKCHAAILQSIDRLDGRQNELTCIECHRGVGHSS